MMENAVILAGVRTPIGKLRGGLARVRPDDLAALTIKQVLACAILVGNSLITMGGASPYNARIFTQDQARHECKWPCSRKVPKLLEIASLVQISR